MEKSVEYLWSTCMGLGKYPAPGTIGSIVGAVLYLFFSFLPFTLHLILWLLVLSYTVIAAAKVSHHLNLVDPQQVISDEVVGMWLVLLIVSPSYVSAGVFAFILFRVFDITKPGPVAKAEKLSGGVGIVADDIVAAIISIVFFFIFGAVL